MNYKLENNLMKNSSYIFEKNSGQQYSDAKFILKKGNLTLFFLQDRITIGVMEPLLEDEAKKQRDLFKSPEKKIVEKLPKRKTYFINILFKNCNSNVNIVGEDELQSKFNYFGQNLPKEGVTNINTYSKIRYNNIYPNIDLVFYSNGNLLEYDFIVKPNANPKHIKLLFEGHDELKLDEEGNAIISVKTSQIKLLKPNSYQIINEIKSQVISKFIVNEDSLSIEAKNYDIKKELIIDPVLFYSTYLGGNNTTEGLGIAVDTLGSAYVTGLTNSSNFLPTNPIIGIPYDGTYAVFVTKFDTNGNLIYSTYINGDGDDVAYGIAVDSSNNAYITGYTNSSNYPTTNSLGVGWNGSDAVFVTKLNPIGNAIVYSAYINGFAEDVAYGIAVDNSNNAYISGFTSSSNYPTTNSLGVPYNSTYAAFATKLNPNGNTILYSIYINGSSNDKALGITVDNSNNAYITGYTDSIDYPTTTNFGTAYNGSTAVFATKLNPSGVMVYSAYLNGTSEDVAFGIAVDNSNNAYIAGYTRSSNLTYPTTNSFGIPSNGTFAAFVTKLNPSGSSIVYSAYINGSDQDYAYGIAIDNFNNAYITGFTSSSDFPKTNGFGVDFNGSGAAFVTQLNSNGSNIVYSAYINGSSEDYGNGVAVDNSNNFYVTGFTASSDFPTKRPYDSDLSGDSNAFVLKFITTEDLLGAIYDEITNQDYGLQEIKAEVSTIEDTVLDPNYGLQEINNTVLNINSKLKKLDKKVDDLEQKICYIDTKLNCILKSLKY